MVAATLGPWALQIYMGWGVYDCLTGAPLAGPNKQHKVHGVLGGDVLHDNLELGVGLDLVWGSGGVR